jgi:CubicO group peptidase (beta-lactamase class C family)
MKFSLILGLSITILFSDLLNGQVNSPGHQDSIPKWMEQNKVPGLAIGIIENNEINEINTFGELKKNIPITKKALFNVASLTKPVVAITVMKLVNDGSWKLDEQVSKYWIDPDIKNDPRYKGITTRIILSHQTGFPNWRNQTPSKKLVINFDPGTRFGYSGEGFEYLRKALENKYGRTLQQLSDSLVFKPLELNDTQYSWDMHLDKSRYAVPHGSNGEPLERPMQTNVIAADWLVTTIEDYCKFGVYVLKGAGLSEELFREMATPHVKIGESPIETMGLGWEVLKNLPGEEYALTHTGHDDGVTTFVLLFPGSGRGIVIFTNGENGFNVISSIVRSIYQIKEIEPYLNDL